MVQKKGGVKTHPDPDSVKRQCQEIQRSMSMFYAAPTRYTNIRYSHFVEYGFAVVYAYDRKCHSCAMQIIEFKEDDSDDTEPDSVLDAARDKTQ